MQVPYVDIAGQHAPLKAALLAAVERVIDRGDFVFGREVEEFERAFAELCGSAHAVSVNSGLDALILTLRGLGVGAGDEVITPANSFIASAAAIAHCGATPVFADVREDLNLDPASVQTALSPRTKALLPVHLTGRPADMDALLGIAERHQLAVIEDAAQAVGARYRGRAVGSLGSAGCFSLHPLKTLNACGDGGVIVTNDAALADTLRLWRNHGLASRDDCRFFAANSRLDTIQAAMLLVKLEHLERWTEARRAHAARYREGLAGLDGLTLPMDQAHEHAAYHTFVVQAEARDALQAHLACAGIGSAVHYPVPIHQSAAGSAYAPASGRLPVTERLARSILSLPIYPELSTAQQDHVFDSIRAFYAA